MAGQYFTNPEEIWKPITDFPGYEVSDHGRIRSFWKQTGFGFNQENIISTNPQRILKQDFSTDCYLRVRLSKDGKLHRLQVHRLVLIAFRGVCPPGHECRHLDGIRVHCWLENLTWGTKFENANDRIQHGNGPQKQGEKHHFAILSDSQVLGIRNLYAKGYRQKDLVKMFNLSRGHIFNIVHRKIWKHI